MSIHNGPASLSGRDSEDIRCRKVPTRSRRASEVGFHVTMRPGDSGGITRAPEVLRLASRLLFEHGHARGLVAFRIADTHKNALRYLLRQESHHGTDFDPAHDGSSLPDFVGMRRIGGDAALARLRNLLPRLTPVELLSWGGLPRLTDSDPDPWLVGDAAAAAFGLAGIRGASDAHHVARLAAAHAVHLSSDHLARLLGVCLRGVQRYRRTSITPELVRAVVLQLHLRTALKTRADPWQAPPAAHDSADL